jgi:2-polyprenyl-3-methyl-5-hydroxy-6-metoxy-1,4-benzoquinol methylase
VNAYEYQYQNFVSNPDPPHQPLYLRKVLEFLGSDSSISRVLDAGCGDGNFTVSLAASGYTMYGIDMSKSGIRIAEEREVGQFAVASLYEDLLRPFDVIDPFDAIISVEVIEHLYSPLTFVEQAHRALRPGGMLIVTTPYWGYLKNIALAVTNRMDGYLTPLWEGGHIKHFSRRTLTALMEENGLVEVYFGGDDVRRIPYLWMGMIMAFRKPLPK